MDAVVAQDVGRDAELFERRALHLDHANLQSHLIRTGDADHVDQLFRRGDEGAGHLGGALGLARTGGRSGQDDAVIDRLGADVGAWRDAAQRVLKRAGSGVHTHPQRQDGAARRIQEDRVGFARRHADHRDAARGMQHGLGHLRIGHDHVARIGRQVDRERGAARQVDHLRPGAGRDGGAGLGLRRGRGPAESDQSGAGRHDQTIHARFPHGTATASAWPSR
ncbi:hypothetical protein D3C80_1082920 [compost metagenome]